MTTADVVDSPTPFAPPVVVKPQEQLTCIVMFSTCLHEAQLMCYLSIYLQSDTSLCHT